MLWPALRSEKKTGVDEDERRRSRCNDINDDRRWWFGSAVVIKVMVMRRVYDDERRLETELQVPAMMVATPKINDSRSRSRLEIVC
ncbi:hypothetical protein Hdeb2414_s0013g00409741 [Helianthus debilis subsp. tardiflorus]